MRRGWLGWEKPTRRRNLSGMKIAVILPAAGASSRFGKQNKLEVELAGRAVLVRSIELFANRPQVGQTIVAVHPDAVSEFKFKWGDKLGFLGVTVVPGGKVERWETVRNALAKIGDDITHVAVHDAARPVTDPAVIDQAFEAAKRFDAVVPGVPVSATLKRAAAEVDQPDDEDDPLDAILGSAGKTVIEARRVIETVRRDHLYQVQTPQVFERSLLERAYGKTTDPSFDPSGITDDAGLVEAMGEPVHVVPGDPLNVKITVPDDVKFAAAVLAMRTGQAPGDALGGCPGPRRKFPTWAEMDDE